jgi:hypothetical protein
LSNKKITAFSIHVFGVRQLYCEKIGHRCGSGQIYRVLERQKWRKIVPRKAHPNKASEVEIETSKKLTSG